jgi:hypothetical protein
MDLSYRPVIVAQRRCPTQHRLDSYMYNEIAESTENELTQSLAAELATTECFDMDLLEAIPKDIGWMLLILGIVGIAIPGMVDIPLLIAGCIILWPSTYRFFQGLARTREQANLLDAPVRFLTRFHRDFEKRNPGGQPGQYLSSDALQASAIYKKNTA